MSELALKIRDLKVYIETTGGLRKVLNGVNLSVRAGRTFALLGESGSGKTCIVQTVLGVHTGLPGAVAGSVEVFGKDVFAQLPKFAEYSEEPELWIRKNSVGWMRHMKAVWKPMMGSLLTLIPQDASTALSPFHNVQKLMFAALQNAERNRDFDSLYKESLSWLTRVEMYDVESVSQRYVHELSGGMAQRVAIALALAPGPKIVVADEPTTGLDATLRMDLIALMDSMVREKGVTLFFVTHDLSAARMLAEDVAVLYAGTVVETGPVEQILCLDCLPKHPYTEYLLTAEHKLLLGEEIDRSKQSVKVAGAGCPYVCYCTKSINRCLVERPELCGDSEHHQIACWLHQ